MRAAALVRPSTIETVEVVAPIAGPGEVLIAVRSVGVCGSDVHFYVDGQIGESVASLPYVLGHEFAGEVVALGPGTSGPPIGTRVAIDPAVPCGKCRTCLRGDINCCPDVRFPGSPPIQGALCEYYSHPAELCVPIPQDLSYDQGAMLEPLGVAIHAMCLADVQPGETVAILGAGPIGLLLLQLALAANASAVYLTEPIEARRGLAETLCASAVCDPANSDVADWISEGTSGAGVDIVLEAAWGGDAVSEAVSIVRPKGRVVLVGIPRDDVCAFPAALARRKELTVKLSRRMLADLPDALDLVVQGQVQLEPLISHHFGLDEADRAFQLVADLDDGVIKAVVRI